MSSAYEPDADPSGPTAADRARPDGGDIRKMTSEELGAVAGAVAQAFFDDPQMRWIAPDDGKRTLRLGPGFKTFIGRVWLPQGESYTHERMIGGAHWMPPGTWHMGLLAQLRLLPSIVRDIRGSTPRLLKLLGFQEKNHPREPAHWYLAAVGVAPAWQGRGFGSALMRPVLARCDTDGVPAYLEASSQRSRTLYERHGFEVIEECRCAREAPPLWRMWREPQPSGGAPVD